MKLPAPEKKRKFHESLSSVSVTEFYWKNGIVDTLGGESRVSFCERPIFFFFLSRRCMKKVFFKWRSVFLWGILIFIIRS